MEINYFLIGKKIKEFRRRNNLTQERLAEKVDLSVTYICMIETGRKHLSLQKIAQIAEALDVTVDKLLYEHLSKKISDYVTDLIKVTSDCSDYELKIILDTLSSLKESMRRNRDSII